jgi:CspA family cold shock protein
MTQGTVRWFNSDLGNGFIAVAGQRDVYVHHSQISVEGYLTLTDNQPVELDIARDAKGPHAENVRPV